jgi:hypothetical protein
MPKITNIFLVFANVHLLNKRICRLLVFLVKKLL